MLKVHKVFITSNRSHNARLSWVLMSGLVYDEGAVYKLFRHELVSVYNIPSKAYYFRHIHGDVIDYRWLMNNYSGITLVAIDLMVHFGEMPWDKIDYDWSKQ